MKTLANIFLGLLLIKAVVSAPPTDSVNYDTAAYEVDLLYNLYDYDENTNIDQGEVCIFSLFLICHCRIDQVSHTQRTITE